MRLSPGFAATTSKSHGTSRPSWPSSAWFRISWKTLTSFLDPGAIAVVLSQFTSSLRTERIAEAMLDSTARIFDLIRAIKDYSYMDQMPIQEVDVPQSLENTLAMVASRLRNVKVIREDEPNAPWSALMAGNLIRSGRH